MLKLLSKKLTPHEKDIKYRDVFGTPDGKLVLEDLNLMFNPDKLHTNDPHTTAIRIGESTPIRYIQRRIEDGMDGSTT